MVIIRETGLFVKAKLFCPFAKNLSKFNETEVNNRKKGCNASVSLFKPILKAINMPLTTPLSYYHGKRYPNILLTRLRMGYSTLNDNLSRMRIIEQPACLCGALRENTVHYFMACPLYTNERRILQESFLNRNAPFNIGTILYGVQAGDLNKDKILSESVHQYIESTRRFQEHND